MVFNNCGTKLGYPVMISSKSFNYLEPIYAGIRRFVKKDMENRFHSYAGEF